MEELISNILDELRTQEHISPAALDRIIQQHNRGARSPVKRYAKKMIWPSYLRIKTQQPEVWRAWNVDSQLEDKLRTAVRMKPRRTASGVATITVITLPHSCSSDCLFCPNDVRMPKSYLHDEPACQRAERSYFDPYLQVARRLRALYEMGHPIDKVELIVLGGTFTDYADAYQRWFVHELFRALNDGIDATNTEAANSEGDGGAYDTVTQRIARYEQAGISSDPDRLHDEVREIQHSVATRALSFNQAIEMLYGKTSRWNEVREQQTATWDELFAQHRANEQAAHRNVGLVIETRPDCLDATSLVVLRQLGCTKIQVGIQSLDNDMLAACGRTLQPGAPQRAFELMRAFGFKSHAHFMVNLPGATPDSDKAAWRTFMDNPAFQPDEVKLYPCALIEGTGLVDEWKKGTWTPYSEHDLVDVLAADVCTTPRHTRISRMIRDFSAGDIVAGNKKANLRQMVEQEVSRQHARTGAPVHEMRMREIATDAINVDALQLQCSSYDTTNTTEWFLEWVDDEHRLAGFLRLSLPSSAFLETHPQLPVATGEAMIREVHIYGTTARLQQQDGSAQHTGLGRALIEKAEQIARDAGYTRINVISAIGTRDYYRSLGFADKQLYQQKAL